MQNKDKTRQTKKREGEKEKKIEGEKEKKIEVEKDIDKERTQKIKDRK